LFKFCKLDFAHGICPSVGEFVSGGYVQRDKCEKCFPIGKQLDRRRWNCYYSMWSTDFQV